MDQKQKKEQALINLLNKKIHELEAQVEELYRYKEMWLNSQSRIESLEEQLRLKKNILAVRVKKDGVNYLLNLTKVIETPAGVIIEGKL